MQNRTPPQPSRRDFLRLGTFAGLACLCPIARLHAEENRTAPLPDPKKLNYCGHTCPPDCPMKLAGQSGDSETKRKAFELWHIEERYGLAFDPDQVFCHGCKTGEPEPGVAVANCPVRPCTRERGFDCCIECGQLAACDKALWERFPDFHKSVLQMQARLSRKHSVE